MHVKQSNTLGRLLVCLTATLSHMCVRRAGSLRGPEDEGTARGLEFKMTSVFVLRLVFHLLLQTKFCYTLGFSGVCLLDI